MVAGLGVAGYAVSPVLAGDDMMPPVKDAATIKECGACHMVFQPAFLPARSWEKMMGGLKDHFGENAELNAATAQGITDYLTANANDKGKSRGKELSASEAPLRITETPWFKHKHGKKDRLSPATLKRRGAKSAADCKACHKEADKGYYEDD
jgi:hypothetical protein